MSGAYELDDPPTPEVGKGRREELLGGEQLLEHSFAASMLPGLPHRPDADATTRGS